MERDETERPAPRHELRDLTPALAERLELPRDTGGSSSPDVEAGEPADEAQLRQGRRDRDRQRRTAWRASSEFEQAVERTSSPETASVCGCSTPRATGSSF